MSIASVIQSQLISTLIEALAPTSLPVGKPGNAARAEVLAAPENGLVSVNLGGIRTELLLTGPIARAAALLPGTILNLRVDRPATATSPARATLIGMAAPGLARSSSVFDQLVEEARLNPGLAARSIAEPPAPSPRAIAGPLVGPLVVRQNGFAPLYANLEAVVTQAGDTLPQPVRAAAEKLLDQRLFVEGSLPTAKDLRAAVTQSGLTHEARLAAGDGETPKLDLKSALLTLKAVLAGLVPAGDKAEALILPLPKTAADGPEPGRLPAIAEQSTANRPPAPRRDAAPVGQGIAEATLNGKTQDTPLVLRALQSETDAALDRLTLSQYASLPVGAELRSIDQTPAQRWLAEIPLAFAQGTAVLPLEIERDAPKNGLTNAEMAIWRVRFALDGEPVGPLQALVTMQGKAISVSVWAEWPHISRMLNKAAPMLRDALTGDSFERAEIEVFTGRPPQPKLSAGQFLDRRS
jgi:Flagellar hook-length control protein FliK